MQPYCPWKTHGSYIILEETCQLSCSWENMVAILFIRKQGSYLAWSWESWQLYYSWVNMRAILFKRKQGSYLAWSWESWQLYYSWENMRAILFRRKQGSHLDHEKYMAAILFAWKIGIRFMSKHCRYFIIKRKKKIENNYNNRKIVIRTKISKW